MEPPSSWRCSKKTPCGAFSFDTSPTVLTSVRPRTSPRVNTKFPCATRNAVCRCRFSSVTDSGTGNQSVVHFSLVAAGRVQNRRATLPSSPSTFCRFAISFSKEQSIVVHVFYLLQNLHIKRFENLTKSQPGRSYTSNSKCRPDSSNTPASTSSSLQSTNNLSH